MSPAKKIRTSIIPCLRYRDASAAIEWLCKAFGLERHFVAAGENGRIDHAQLRIGDQMVMLSSPGDGPYDDLVKPPAAAGGVTTQSIYVVVEDPDAHYRRAVAGGAEIAMEIEDKGYGGRGYTCRDPEGNVWSFGDYDPWASE